MSQGNFRTFEYEGKKVIFNTNVFKDIFKTRAEKQNMNLGTYEAELGNLVGVSENAVHGWRNGQYGPADLSLIKCLAEGLGVKMEMLLKEKNEVNVQVKLEENRKQAVIGLYKEFVKFYDKYYVDWDYWDGFETTVYNIDCVIENLMPREEVDDEIWIEGLQDIRALKKDIVDRYAIFLNDSRALRSVLNSYMLEVPIDLFDAFDELLKQTEETISMYVNDYLSVKYNEETDEWESDLCDEAYQGLDELALYFSYEYTKFYDFARETLVPMM